MDQFCAPVSPFWWKVTSCNTTVSLNATCHDEVDLTQCFEDTAIVYGIFIAFWFLAGAWAGVRFLCGGWPKPKLPISALHVAKLLLTCVLLAASLADVIATAVEGRRKDVAQFQYLTPSLMAVTMLLALLLLDRDRRQGRRSSGLLLLFWMGMTVYGSFKLRTLVLLARDEGDVDNKFWFSTFCIQYSVYIIQFVLSMIPEPRSKRALQVEYERKPCPEYDSTFLSRITWWWLNGLIWLGWRKSLEYSDLTDLNEEDKALRVGARFEKSWSKEIKRAGVVFVPDKEQADNDFQLINAEDSDRVPLVVTTAPKKEKEPSVVWALTVAFGDTFAIAALFKLAQDLLGFAGPQILKLMIRFTKDESQPDWHGYFYAILLFVAAVVQSLLLHQYFHRCFLVGMRFRTAVITAVYRKALKLSSKARRNRTVGEIINLMSVDAQRIMDLCTYFHMIWSAPLQIVVSLIFLWFTLGPSIFVGFAVMLVMIPVNAVIAAKSRQYQVALMQRKDSRIKIVNEVLNGIKVIKLYAWEIPFEKLIMSIRQSELSALKKSAYLSVGASFTSNCVPFMVALATFATYSLINRNSEDPRDRLTADKAFVALSLFNILRFPLAMLPRLISSLVQASVSVKRLRNFLKSEELDSSTVDWNSEPATEHEESVSVVDGTFSWDSTSSDVPTLSNVELHVKPGQIVAVVGQVGAGKSSLIQSLLGEMEKLSGTVSMRGSIAYIPQQAWIQNATVKDNVLFGKSLNGLLYTDVINACALTPDLEILPGGDMTEIGEKGINLSGGQKQRVSLARAVYQDADVYLLDDPLSAVDSHVGKHIFDKVIGPNGMLKGKVRILVTHGVGFLPQCDQIVVMDSGRISEVGSYEELKDNNGAFAEFLCNYANIETDQMEGEPELPSYVDDEDEELPRVTTPGPPDDAESFAQKEYIPHQQRSRDAEKLELKHFSSKTDSKRQLFKQSLADIREAAKPATEPTALIAEETVEKGRVNFSVLFTYCKACTYYMSFLTLFFYVVTNGCSVAANVWLAEWSNAEGHSVNMSNYSRKTACDYENGPAIGCYLGIYATLGFSQAVFILLGSFSLALAAVFASGTLHNGMLKTILRSPMSFFDTTPLGRILNRFSKDIYTIDETVPRSIRSFIVHFLRVISILIVIFASTPIFTVVIIPLGMFYFLVQRVYVATSRQLKRLESTTRSPIYSHFQETIYGSSSIRAYRQQDRFVAESDRRVDYNQISYYSSICSNRWLAIRLEFVGNAIILLAALFAAIQRNYSDELKLHISPGLVGLSISYALEVTQSLNWMVRMTSELETSVVSVERTKEYSELPTEAPAVIETRRPPDGWPSDGCIKFERYSTRYRPGLDPVLKDISVEIPGGTKVGIVGRTGAGKSSLTLAMFRIIEAAGGSILLDNINIAVFGLEDLRSRLTIIPQDPVLFSGSLRMNLDPFETYSDESVWKALESAHLLVFVSELAEKLQYSIAEGGENLSVGQRQLVCLARALLHKTKILVLDEATAAVDLETDDLIQKTIRAEFADNTIITIAHRLNTVMDYEYIMVLDNGCLVEYDRPTELLSRIDSVFYSMAKDACLV